MYFPKYKTPVSSKIEKVPRDIQGEKLRKDTVKLGIRVMKLVGSLIGWKVTVTGQGFKSIFVTTTQNMISKGYTASEGVAYRIPHIGEQIIGKFISGDLVRHNPNRFRKL